MIETFILSLIQGIAEFLPISSSSHLILISEYLEFENQSLSIDVSLHIGSFLAVIIYFSNDLINFFKNKIIFYKILLSSLPVMIVGFFLVEFDIINKITATHSGLTIQYLSVGFSLKYIEILLNIFCPTEFFHSINN